jgi:hypothetical protein
MGAGQEIELKISLEHKPIWLALDSLKTITPIRDLKSLI